MEKQRAHNAAITAVQGAYEYTQSEALREADNVEIMHRLEAFDELWAHLNAVHDEVLTAEGADFEGAETAFIAAEQQYYAIKGALRRKLASNNQRAANEQPLIAVQIRMPTQQHNIQNTWGEFNGSLTKWEGFYDRFVAAIHSNQSITPAYKFECLSKSLTGEATKTMEEWQLTNESYDEAWERLNQVYNREYETSRIFLRQFTQLPALPARPSSNELKHISNVTLEMLRQLQSQGLPVHHWDMIVVPMIHERLDDETARQWELERVSEIPTIRQMLEFLDRQAASANSGPSTSTGR